MNLEQAHCGECNATIGRGLICEDCMSGKTHYEKFKNVLPAMLKRLASYDGEITHNEFPVEYKTAEDPNYKASVDVNDLANAAQYRLLQLEKENAELRSEFKLVNRPTDSRDKAILMNRLVD